MRGHLVAAAPGRRRLEDARHGDVPRMTAFGSAPQKGDVARFVNYAMTTSQQFGAALDFAPLPRPVLHAGINTLKSL